MTILMCLEFDNVAILTSTFVTKTLHLKQQRATHLKVKHQEVCNLKKVAGF